MLAQYRHIDHAGVDEQAQIGCGERLAQVIDRGVGKIRQQASQRYLDPAQIMLGRQRD